MKNFIFSCKGNMLLQITRELPCAHTQTSPRYREILKTCGWDCYHSSLVDIFLLHLSTVMIFNLDAGLPKPVCELLHIRSNRANGSSKLIAENCVVGVASGFTTDSWCACPEEYLLVVKTELREKKLEQSIHRGEEAENTHLSFPLELNPHNALPA